MNLSAPINELLGQVIRSVDGNLRRFTAEAITGGSINKSYRITDSNSNKYFLKTNLRNKFPALFEKEKMGLELLGVSNSLKVPTIIYCGETTEEQVLVLEWIEPGERTDKFWRTFGEQLVQLHEHTRSGFGLDHDNYMGSLLQANSATKKWTEFFANHRLRPQVMLASNRRLLETRHIELFEKLCLKLDSIYPNSPSSLVHGDLWAGNFICSMDGMPVLIDPAVYYGHASVDLGLTTLFGGFETEFYDAYNYHSPFPSNYEEQWEISNLYPLLIHLNLFGSGYLSQISETLQKYAGF